MAIPGNSRKSNFSKAIIKRQFHSRQLKAITRNAISEIAILGNPRQSNSRHGNFRQFQPRQFQDIPGKAISGIPGKVIQYKKIPDSSRQAISGKAVPSIFSQGNFSQFEGRLFQAKKLRAIPENTRPK